MCLGVHNRINVSTFTFVQIRSSVSILMKIVLYLKLKNKFLQNKSNSKETISNSEHFILILSFNTITSVST